MHFCTAKIALSSDITSVVDRGVYSPVSWPEIEVIRYIHGGTAVDDIEVIAYVPQSGKAERERLRILYGEEPLIALWGGRNTPGEMDANRATIKPGVKWFNPITFQEEITQGEEEVAAETEAEDPIGDEAPAKKKK